MMGTQAEGEKGRAKEQRGEGEEVQGIRLPCV